VAKKRKQGFDILTSLNNTINASAWAVSKDQRKEEAQSEIFQKTANGSPAGCFRGNRRVLKRKRRKISTFALAAGAILPECFCKECGYTDKPVHCWVLVFLTPISVMFKAYLPYSQKPTLAGIAKMACCGGPGSS
jgi:hypothetical protein